MKAFLSPFFAVLALLVLCGCNRVATKGAGGSQDSREEGAPGSVLGNGVRTALIIGNGKYKKLQRLDACPRDAEQMAAAFQKIGIQIHGGKPLVNLTANEMDAALNDFVRSLDRGSEAYIYYSGHGTQMGGGNYLLPVDFDAQFESQARREAIALDDILALLEKTQSSLRVVILDACRDPGNFLPGESALKGAYAKGLAEQKVEAPETLVCFATKHGTPALADDTASYYTRALAEEIVKPGRVEDVLKAVARRVYVETDKRQLPFTYGSLLQDHFFAGPALVNTITPAAANDPAMAARIAELEKSLAAERAKRSALASPAAAPALEVANLETPKLFATPAPLPSPDPADEKALAEAKIQLAALEQQFKFSDAAVKAAAIHVSSVKGQAEREALMKRAEWLDKFKRTLVADITTIGYAAPIQKRNGTMLPAGAHRATEDQIEVTTPFGNISAPWADISSDSILAIAQAFLKIKLPQDRMADRQWYLGVFAIQVGKTQEGRSFLTQASQAKGEYKDQLSRYFESLPEMKTPAITSGMPRNATKDAPFVNSLGMKFVPVPGTTVLFSVWETRVCDYEKFAKETNTEWGKTDFAQGPTHPAVRLSWQDAQAFCQWLSNKEGRRYRLPTDAEWSMGAGLGKETGSTPKEKSGKAIGYPWGPKWPAPPGNEAHSYTKPMESYSPNNFGLFCMGGNIWELCQDQYEENFEKVLRGPPSRIDNEQEARTSNRQRISLSFDGPNVGFRCVLVISGG